MKQVLILLLLALFWFTWYSTYNIYVNKDYKSSYSKIKKSDWVKIIAIEFDKEKIDKLNSKIKKLREDPVFRLQLYNITKTEKQPLFLDSFSPIYNKILQQQRKINIYSQ